MDKWLFIIIIVGCLQSCYEPIEGCLDVDALNYSVSADESCENCCNLPEISITMSYRWKDESFNLGDTLSTGNSTLILKDFHFFLSQIDFSTPAGDFLYLEDSVQLFDENDQLFYLPDNFRYFDLQRFSTDLEGLRYEGELSTLIMDLGLPQVIQSYNLDSLQDNSAIGTVPGDAIENGTFLSYSFEILFLSGDVQFLEAKNEFPLKKIVIPLKNMVVTRAKNLDIDLVFDLGFAMDNLSSTSSVSENKALLESNLDLAFFQKL